jgi:benzoyl-CoA 2,3-dioxygenase component A
MASPETSSTRKQHLIDPEVCIRCDTCEEICPIGAVTHDGNNYVVDAEKCNFCLDCIQPCPTGSIDNWRIVSRAYTLAEQFSWDELPPQEQIESLSEAEAGESAESADAQAGLLIAQAHIGTGGKSVAPPSASKPKINLYNRNRPAIARVAGSFRLTDPNANNDVRHIILDLGTTTFPVLEGQSIGIVAPGTDADGKPHDIRLYSVASPREGEKSNANNLSLTVKREPNGVCSNYLCDLQKGDQVQMTGPFGATFLMPDDPSANIVMICTGTGSAPFRGFTERRRRNMKGAPGRMVLYFGARRPEELPYFGPLQKVPNELLRKHFAYSRVPGEPKTYVQDCIRATADEIAPLLMSDRTHLYICGLKGMEAGVDEALVDLGRGAGLDWPKLRGEMRVAGRYHVETY